jgi:hypothetical protein
MQNRAFSVKLEANNLKFKTIVTYLDIPLQSITTFLRILSSAPDKGLLRKLYGESRGLGNIRSTYSKPVLFLSDLWKNCVRVLSMEYKLKTFCNHKSYGYTRLTGGVYVLYVWIMVCAVLSSKAVSLYISPTIFIKESKQNAFKCLHKGERERERL